MDTVFIRSKPDINSEVVGHVIKDDVFYGYPGEFEGERWILVNIVDSNVKGYIRRYNPNDNTSLITNYLGHIE